LIIILKIEVTKGAIVSALKKKIELKESRDFFLEIFKKNLKLFLFVYYHKNHFLKI